MHEKLLTQYIVPWGTRVPISIDISVGSRVQLLHRAEMCTEIHSYGGTRVPVNIKSGTLISSTIFRAEMYPH